MTAATSPSSSATGGRPSSSPGSRSATRRPRAAWCRSRPAAACSSASVSPRSCRTPSRASSLSFSGVRAGLRVTGLDALGDVLDDFITPDGADSATLSGEGIVTVRIAPQKQPDKRAALTKLCYSERPHPATFAPAFEMERVGNAPSYTSVNARAGYPVVEGQAHRGRGLDSVDAEVGRRRARHRRRVRLRGVRPARQRPVVGLPRHLDGAIPDPDGEHLRRHLDGGRRGGRRRRQPRDDRHHRQHSGRTRVATPCRRSTRSCSPTATTQFGVQGLWQGWQSTHQGDAPPPPSDTAWQALPDQIYHFHTAAEPTNPPVTVVNFADESTFDPRATARYLIGFDPDGSGPPHFLDDPIRANFTVDHLPQLLGLYGRDLQLKLRRTSQPPGALAGGGHPPDEPTDKVRPLQTGPDERGRQAHDPGDGRRSVPRHRAAGRSDGVDRRRPRAELRLRPAPRRVADGHARLR